MDELKDFLKLMAKPTVAVVFITFVIIVIRGLLDRHLNGNSQHRIYRRLIMGTLVILCIMLFVFSLPNEQNLRGQVIGLMGVLMSGAIALSATTFLGNALAGVMLRSVQSFRPGDFINVNGHRGRVSARGFFHTEIQSDDRDLTTLPNLFIATNPVKVTNSKGTIIRTKISLGYDEPRQKIENLLIEAAKKAELSDPFVQVIELGDFSVVYRINAVLTDASRFLSGQSRLNAMVLDTLQKAGVEIVSPNFMNTRNVTDKKFIATNSTTLEKKQSHPEPERVIFDKALQAEIIEDQKSELQKIASECEELKERIKMATEDDKKKSISKQLATCEKRQEILKHRISRMTEEIEADK